jgi:hypothetical protein
MNQGRVGVASRLGLVHVALQIVVLIHLIGFACLFGGSVVQLRTTEPDVNAAMLHGAWLALVTGAALVGFAVIGHDQLNYPKLSIKAALTLFLVILVSKNRKFSSIPKGLLALIGAMTLANATVAVLWQ